MNTETNLVLGLVFMVCSGMWLTQPCGAQEPVGPGGGKAGSGQADPHSYGNPREFQVPQCEIDLTVDFERHELWGYVVLEVHRQRGVARDVPLTLDTHGLTIETVSARQMFLGRPAPFVPAPFKLAAADPILGSKLTIDLTGTAMQVLIKYRTSSTAGALQWLDPSRTAGKKKPFMFTQSEAIHARSWIPLQDSPGARVWFTATIRVPPGLTAVMAAESRVNPNDAARGVFRFSMPQSVPPYLVAMAVGDLTFKPLSHRTGVWAEPATIEAAAYEFADVEAMLAACEKDFGPYRWGRYDILVLPPSFPFGGMENPRLTFATPTILAGDRSLVSLIAHELAHSWSGNLVSNATWRDFWLNEGFTTYLERRIVESLFGRERADMEAVLGLADMREQMMHLPPSDRVLHIDLTGRDPDLGMTRVPYEKGALLLRAMEQAFGRKRFDTFLRDYFNTFRFQSITTAEFVAFFREKLLGNDSEADRILDLDRWLEGAEIPQGPAEPSSERIGAVDRAVAGWLDGSTATEKLEREGLVHPGVAAIPARASPEFAGTSSGRSRSKLRPDRARECRDRPRMAARGHS